MTFEPGRLIPSNNTGNSHFEIDTLEVWGVGGEEIINRALRTQAEYRGVSQDIINKARKVDKAQFFNNSFDQEFLLSGTLQHREQGKGRGDF